MKALDKRVFRNFKSSLGQYLAIFILMTTTIGFGSGFLSVSDCVDRDLNENQISCNMEDGNFTLQEEFDFSNSEYEIEKNFYVNLEKEYTLRVYETRQKINKLSLFDGIIPEKENEIAIDRAFANSNELKINDYIELPNQKFKVVGIISVPDYNSLFKSNNDLMMNTKDFGIGFVNKETFAKLEEEYDTKYNYSYKGDTDDIKEYILNNQLKMVDILPKESNQSINFLLEDMGSDVPSMRVLIYIVVAILGFVFVILANNNIENDSKSIGTLKALGCTNREIIFHYMKLPLAITIISALIGNILGYTVFIEPFKNLYYGTYSVPPFNLKLNMEAFLLTTIIPVIIMLAINYLLLRKKINLKAIKFLRNDIRKSKNKNIRLSKKIPFKTRFKLRIILENIGNFVTLFLGIYLSSLLLLFSVGLSPIIEHYKDTVITTTPSEYQYIVNTPIDTDGYKFTQYQMKTYYELAKKDTSVNFMGLENTDKYFDDLKLNDLDDGIIISDSLALKLDIKVGDNLKFTDDNTKKEYEFKVLDIYEYRSAFAVFLKQADLNKLLDLPENYFNSYLSDEKMDIDNKYVVKEISREDIGNVAGQMLDSFEGLIKMIMLFAIVIYLVLMYILTKVIIEKNSLNISLMKVMGYGNKEINKLFLRGTSISVIALLILVMPLENLSIDVVMKFAMTMMEGYFEVILPLSVYITVIAIGIMTYFVINQLHIRRINKIPMQDALKDRE